MVVYNFKGRDIVSIEKFTKEELLYIIDIAKQFKNDPNYGKELLKGKTIASLFFENSTRTRESFDRAIQRLGATKGGFAGKEGTSVMKNETLKHTLKMYEGYGFDAIVMRHNLDGAGQWAADCMSVPILNGGDGKCQHPTQAMLDLFSIIETQGKLDNLVVMFVGDLKYGRTVYSLTNALSKWKNMTFIYVAPEKLQIPKRMVEELRSMGHVVELHNTYPLSAIKAADIIYRTRIQKERIADSREFEDVSTHMRITLELIEGVKDNLKILHPLPMDSIDEDISPDVEDTKYAYYFLQAANGVYIRQALLSLVLGAIGQELPQKPKQTTNGEESNFEEVQMTHPPDRRDNRKSGDIEEGTVLDHLSVDTELDKVYEILKPVLLGKSFHFSNRLDSTRFGNKGVLKVEGIYLSESWINKLALVAPNTSVSYVKNNCVFKKGRPRLPTIIDKIIICPNPSCISREEHLEKCPSKFYTIDRKEQLLRCHYCGAYLKGNEIKVK